MSKANKLVKMPKAVQPAEILSDTRDMPTARDFLSILSEVVQDVAGIALDKDADKRTRVQAAAVAGSLAIKAIDAVQAASDVHREMRERARQDFEPEKLWNPYCDEPQFNPFNRIEYEEAATLLENDAKAAGLSVGPHKRGLTRKKHQ